MASSIEDVRHVQVKFYTKQDRYAIPDTIFSLPSTSTTQELTLLINSILQDANDNWGNVDFDFLLQSEFVKLTLGDHIAQKGISTETVVELEYLERHPPPSPQDSLLHDDWVSAVHTYNGHILTGCYDNTIHIWTLEGVHKLTIPGHTGVIKDVSWISKQGDINMFVSASGDQTAILWEWDQSKNSVECIHICRGHARSVDTVCVNKAGTKFATGSFDKMLKIWSVDTENSSDNQQSKKMKRESGRVATNKVPIATISGHTEAITSALWTHDLEVCTASWDHTIRFWDLDIGGVNTVLNGTKAFLAIAVSPISGQLISASADRHLRLWDRRSKDSLVKTVFTSHNGWVSCVDWSTTNENLFISGSYDNVLKLWDIRSPKAPLFDMAGHNDKILCCDWSNSDLIMSGGADNHLKIFQSGGQRL